ncbi:FAD-dependent oxidoreductase [Microbacterium sp. NPDC055357]
MDDSYDVVVLGSGAAGLTAALAAAAMDARVAVLEKADLLGGTTALSGAGIWVPGNHRARDAGVEDSVELGLEYLLSLSNDMILPELAEALLRGGPEFIDFLESETDLVMQLVEGYPDYHTEHPGALPGGGRTLEPGLFSFTGMEAWIDRIGGDVRRATLVEMPLGGGTGVIPPDVVTAREEHHQEGLGRALIGGLLKGFLARGGDVFTGVKGSRLATTNGAVTGVEIESESGTRTISARAVIIATGGFEYDRDLVRAFLRGPITRRVGVPSNTGDGLRMAMRLGAELGNMREAWWSPVIAVPGERRDGGENGLLVARERALPGSIIVNRAGRRFANEAANYNAFGGAFHHLDESRLSYPNLPAFLLFDQSTVDRFGVLGQAPGAPVPDWMTRADTLEELAVALGVDAAELAATVTDFNAHARRGVDPDFSRGQSAYDRFPGGRMLDPDSPHSTLGPLETGPFYGTEIYSSALGTKGGPRTDASGRVRHVDGHIIPGLYAAGNAAASPSGMVYGGAGGTLVVAGVWGMNAGKAAATDGLG